MIAVTVAMRSELAGQATLSKEVPHGQDRDHRLLALVGDNGELDLPFLDIEDSPSLVALRENLAVLQIVCMRLSFTDLGQKELGIEDSRFRGRQAIRRGSIPSAAERALGCRCCPICPPRR